jgi:uncharacterized membrane protein YdjX (TVP38/TMEM64 family)
MNDDDTDKNQNADAQFLTPTKRLLVPRRTTLKSDVDASPTDGAIITNDFFNISTINVEDIIPSPSSPTRQNSKSAPLLVSGCGAVSPLNPLDSPLERCSPIRNHGMEGNCMDFPGDHFFLENLSASSPNLSFDNLQEGDEFMDYMLEIRPIRRHTIAGAKHNNSTQHQGTSPKQEDNQGDDVKRSTMTTQATSTNWDNDVPASNPYRYYMCSDFIVKVVRRVCRPHVNIPSCIKHLFPRCEPLKPHHQRIVCRTLIITFMIITITFVLLDLLILHQYLHVWLDGTLSWLTSNPVAGGLAFIGVILMASLCFFPVSLLTLGAGYVYIDLYGLGVGIIAAFLVCYSGCLLGAAVCFARSRYLMRQLIQKFSNRYPIVMAVDRAFASMGFRLFLLLRLSPAMPFNALNYIGGITAVKFRDYWRATW